MNQITNIQNNSQLVQTIMHYLIVHTLCTTFHVQHFPYVIACTVFLLTSPVQYFLENYVRWPFIRVFRFIYIIHIYIYMDKVYSLND